MVERMSWRSIGYDLLSTGPPAAAAAAAAKARQLDVISSGFMLLRIHGTD
jgi:hypothetical protein